MDTTSEKLNRREQYKARLRPYDYYPQLENLDFEALGEGDRYYLQDFGIFNVDFLEDEFTLRARILGGRMSAEQLNEFSNIITKYDLELILTARAGIQLHGLNAENILEVFTKVNALGIATWQSFGDNVRNITTDVFDGVSSSSKIEVYPIMQQMQEFILKNPRYVGMLPRRVSIGITGNRVNVNSFFANDLAFLLAKKDDAFGFNVYMGGKNSEMVQSADIFLLPDEVMPFYKAFLESFYKHGSRSSRAYTRVFHAIKRIGMQSFVALIQEELPQTLKSAGETLFEIEKFQTFESLTNNTFAFCYETDFGRIDSKELRTLASFAQENSADIRLGMDQNIYIIGLKEQTTPPLHSAKRSSTIVACAGAGKCPYSAWSIKDEAGQYLPLDEIYQHRIQIGFSGCAKGCGRHRHTDIGLIGLKTNQFGASEGGVRIFIGAQYSSGDSAGVELFSMVPFTFLQDTLKMLIQLFELSHFDSFETFAKEHLQNHSSHFIALWILFNLRESKLLPIPLNSDDEETTLLQNSFHTINEFVAYTSLKELVSVVTKNDWTIEGKSAIYTPPIRRTVFR